MIFLKTTLASIIQGVVCRLCLLADLEQLKVNKQSESGRPLVPLQSQRCHQLTSPSVTVHDLLIVRTAVVSGWFLMAWSFYCCYNQCNLVNCPEVAEKMDNTRNETGTTLSGGLGDQIEVTIRKPVVGCFLTTRTLNVKGCRS